MNKEPVKDVSFGLLRTIGYLWYLSFLIVLFVVGIGMMTGEMEITLKNALLLTWMPFVVAFCMFVVVSPIVCLLALVGLLR